MIKIDLPTYKRVVRIVTLLGCLAVVVAHELRRVGLMDQHGLGLTYFIAGIPVGLLVNYADCIRWRSRSSDADHMEPITRYSIVVPFNFVVWPIVGLCTFRKDFAKTARFYR